MYCPGLVGRAIDQRGTANRKKPHRDETVASEVQQCRDWDVDEVLLCRVDR